MGILWFKREKFERRIKPPSPQPPLFFLLGSVLSNGEKNFKAFDLSTFILIRLTPLSSFLLFFFIFDINL